MTRIALLILWLGGVTLAGVLAAKTNGIVSLKWNNGDPQETTVVNQTTGKAYNAGTNGSITIGKLVVGDTNVFVATNIVGASNPVTNVNVADSTKLSIVVHSFLLTWPGRAGTLQSTTNLETWSDLQPMAENSSVVITNNSAQKYFRVKLN